jgi:peptidoglycan/LPS O-acetylase OafA/YrhL
LAIALSKSRTHFESLDSIRTLACFCVLSTHLFWENFSGFFMAQPSLQGLPLDCLAFALGNATFGVRLFMTLSGFLITYLMLQEVQLTGRFSLGSFYMRRILRIWPCYFLIVGYVFLLYPWVKKLLGLHFPIHEQVWPFLFFLSNFELIRLTSTPGVYPNSQLSPLWSVSIEEQYYLIWPLILLKLGPSRLGQAALFLGSLAWLSQFLFWDTTNLWTLHTGPCFLYLLAGSWLGFAYHRYPQVIQDRIRRLGYPAVVAITGAALAILFWVGINSGSSKYWLPLYGPATALFCCWLMISQIVFQGHRFCLDRIRPMVFLAKYTYGMYIYHRVVQWYVSRAFVALGWVGQKWIALAWVNGLTLLLTILVSHLSLHTLEKAFARRRHHYTPKPIETAANSST